jgi:XTP/dITP diphosphohydrolase
VNSCPRFGSYRKSTGCWVFLKVIFLLATRNRHKVRELRRLLKGLPVRFLTLDAFGNLPSVQETGSTFRANAVKKAVEVSRRTIFPVLSEDSGLEVRALGGRPGVHSARYACPPNDRANLAKLMRELAEIPLGRRQAQFVCAMAFAVGGRLIQTFHGSCAGSIVFHPAGKNGFGYDPVFIPRGHRKTMSQLGARVKDALSHRRRTADQFRRYLERLEQIAE